MKLLDKQSLLPNRRSEGSDSTALVTTPEQQKQAYKLSGNPTSQELRAQVHIE